MSVDFTDIQARIEAAHSAWKQAMVGDWPPPKVTKEMKVVAKALCRAGCQPGLWQDDEIEKHVRKNWKRHLWDAAVAIRAMRPDR